MSFRVRRMRTLHSDYYSATKKPAFSLHRALLHSPQHHILRACAPRNEAIAHSQEKSDRSMMKLFVILGNARRMRSFVASPFSLLLVAAAPRLAAAVCASSMSYDVGSACNEL